MSHEWMMEVLDRGEWIELAMAGKDGWPYTVPLNYGFGDDFIIIHCAKEGKKIDLLKENNKVAFNVTVDEEIIRNDEDPDKIYDEVQKRIRPWNSRVHRGQYKRERHLR